MIVKRKLYSVMDKEGNLGYYLYDEATGEEKLFSAVEEEERIYANVRKFKKATGVLWRKSFEGKLTTKDLKRFNNLKGKNSIKTIMNPNYDKVAKSSYNKVDKLTKGEFGKSVSRPEYIKQSKSISSKAAKAMPMNLKKGEAKAAVEAMNQLSIR